MNRQHPASVGFATTDILAEGRSCRIHAISERDFKNGVAVRRPLDQASACADSNPNIARFIGKPQ